MRRLGRISHVSQQGHLILRTEKSPPIGAKVVDKKVKPVGTIIDVFGPVKEPYVSISPVKGVDTESIVDQVVYIYKKPEKDAKR
ncbi:MAG: H/ACA RNA-protein complex protein Gar1 [Candidatus Thorarchaeota archaeon]|nr:H/ACA RNA-protein complex protein Gar1 [Candidatus Thorarchaeota archaeon]